RIDDVFSDAGFVLDIDVPDNVARIRRTLDEDPPAFLLAGAPLYGDLTPMMRARFVVDGPPIVVVTLRDETDDLLEAARLAGGAYRVPEVFIPPRADPSRSGSVEHALLQSLLAATLAGDRPRVVVQLPPMEILPFVTPEEAEIPTSDVMRLPGPEPEPAPE